MINATYASRKAEAPKKWEKKFRINVSIFQKLGENLLKAKREQQSGLIMFSMQTQYGKTTL